MSVLSPGRVLAFAVSLLLPFAAVCDCLDEVMPRPREIMRGINGCLKTPSRPGAYQLVVRGGKPHIQGDDEGRRYAMATFRQLKRLAEADGATTPMLGTSDHPSEVPGLSYSSSPR